MKLDLSSAGESPSCLSAAEAEAAPEAERPGSFSAPSPLAAATELSLDEGGGSGLPICEQVWASNAKGLFLASSCGRQRQGEGEGGETRDPRSSRGGGVTLGAGWVRWERRASGRPAASGGAERNCAYTARR